MNIADALRDHARDRPHHPAIEDGDRVITYAELDALVDAAAANLQAAGIAPGDVVGMTLPDSAEHLIMFCAAARAGAVMLAIDNALPLAEKQRLVANANPRALIATAGSQTIGDLPVLPVGKICGPATSAFERPVLEADHPLIIAQSSGTTGVPKSFLWSHAQMHEQARRHQRFLGLSWQDRYLAVIRMSFVWERKTCLILFCLGATIVVNHSRSMEDLVMRVAAGRITVLILTPAHLTHILGYPSDQAPLFPSLRVMLVGGAPLAHQDRILAKERLTPNFYEQLGTNETGFMILSTPADQDAHPDAVGRVIEGIEAQVLDADGHPLPPGDVGLVGFRGEVFPTEYVNNPKDTARAFRDGWFYPGDLAAIDADGYYFFKGRADDIISNEGTKFYPIEVENVLLMHPAVAEVAAFGWPHPAHGEMAAAVVTTKAPVGAEELEQFCRERVAYYKVPAWIMIVSAMPRNPMGKIVKTRLKEMLRAELAKASP